MPAVLSGKEIVNPPSSFSTCARLLSRITHKALGPICGDKANEEGLSGRLGSELCSDTRGRNPWSRLSVAVALVTVSWQRETVSRGGDLPISLLPLPKAPRPIDSSSLAGLWPTVGLSLVIAGRFLARRLTNVPSNSSRTPRVTTWPFGRKINEAPFQQRKHRKLATLRTFTPSQDFNEEPDPTGTVRTRSRRVIQNTRGCFTTERLSFTRGEAGALVQRGPLLKASVRMSGDFPGLWRRPPASPGCPSSA
ncbi:hypothetical protein SKAU_G00258820 [Synaphobranchus kaupii]|uniref:Uncharacterized protein n=1 Tax=Synaphobranchus kaupii TaxID=118154 RepID=A0A9Q1ISN6_SYNKA|nr:hypothetical protein SKAU_G00258820 [Synaphobranchus kaupii]